MSRGGAIHRAAGLAIALAVVATGCRGDDDDATASTPPGATSETTTAPSSTRAHDEASDTTSPESDVTSPESASTPSTTTRSSDAPPTSVEGFTVPDGDQPEVLGPLGSSEIELATGDGTVQIGSGDIPDAIPTDFPLPADFELELSSDIGDQAGFSGRTALAFDELVELYRGELDQGSYRLVAERVMTETVAVFEFGGDAGSGEVAISSAPGGGRSVLVTFSR